MPIEVGAVHQRAIARIDQREAVIAIDEGISLLNSSRASGMKHGGGVTFDKGDLFEDGPWIHKAQRTTSANSSASAVQPVRCPRAIGGRAGTARRPAESDDAAKAAVARVLAGRRYSAQYGRQQVAPQRRQIGQIEGVANIATVPPSCEQPRAAEDSEVAGNLRG